MSAGEEIVENDQVIGPLLRAALAQDTLNSAGSLSVLKYRPERRLCARLGNGRPHILKIWYNTRGERIYRNLCRLNESIYERNGPVRIPEPLFYNYEAHAMVYPEVNGEQATAIFKRGRSRDWIQPVAAAVAALHQSSVPDLKYRSPGDELQSIEKQLNESSDAAINGGIKKAIQILDTVEPRTNRLSVLHRDLYDQQIFFTPGGSIYLIDLDDMASGDAMLDVGNFLAHFHLMKHWQRRPEKFNRMRERFVRAYAREVERNVEELIPRLSWYEAAALTRLSAIQLKKGKTVLAELLLNDAMRIAG